MSKQMSDGIDILFKRIQKVIYDLDWFQNESNYRNAVLGHLYAEYRITFGHVTPELFEELKQNSFFLETCNQVRISQYDCIQKSSIELSCLKDLVDN